MNRITISWEVVTISPLKVKYFFNGSSVGVDKHAFEKIIRLIKADTSASAVLFTGRSTGNSDTGASIQETLPFYDYWDVLMEAVGKRKIMLDIR